MTTIASIDITEQRRKQAEKWEEVMRLGRLAALATRLDDRTSYCADLLAELGLIHPTPDGKWDWMHRGEL